MARTRIVSSIFGLAALLAAALPATAQEVEEPEVHTGGAKRYVERLNAAVGPGSGGGGTVATTPMTNTFSPSTLVDYKRLGAEPTVTVDRYPFVPGQFGATEAEFRDLVYVSAPIGFPLYSLFWKSSDHGQSFRMTQHNPGDDRPTAAGEGGGDSHQVVGERTHKVYYVDLPLACVTMNVSADLGETWTPDALGCGFNPGIDDRQWVEADEEFPATAHQGGNIYVSFIQFATLTAPTLSLARSTHGAAPPGTFVTDSVCNTLTLPAGSPAPLLEPAADDTPTPCPDPLDPHLEVAGPVVANKWDGSPTEHFLYIPFIRRQGPNWSLHIAKSTNGGTTWTRDLVAELGPHRPDNIFPQLTIDRAGNLYYTWAQTEEVAAGSENFGGETDVYYAFSTGAGETGTWSPPINLTPENNNSAVFPWMVAGDAGRVDLVYYESNTGLNPNIAFFDDDGNECEPEGDNDPECRPNPSVWEVMFAQSLNALNTGANFRGVQVSDHPIHVGQVCTAGLACRGDRSLLDFFTVDIDHLGAAHVSWTDTMNQFGIGVPRYSRQLSGSSVFKNQTITLQNTWPVKDHSVVDRAGDVYNATGAPTASCPGMDVLAASAQRRGDILTASLTLNAPPTFAEAVACGGGYATGGVWGVEFWASDDPSDYFYLAYRDNPPDGVPAVEAGDFDRFSVSLTSFEFRPRTEALVGGPRGSCFTASPPAPCTIAMTLDLSTLGIDQGTGLYSFTGLSTYYFATDRNPPFIRLALGDSEQADATAALSLTGTGRTKPRA